jgi:hypothetical protein
VAQIAETSLEARIANLESQVRSLTASNWTDRASVVNAEGRYVPLSSLAFGQVAARDTGQVSLTANTATWFYGNPSLDVYVQGGRLRLDVAGWLIVGGLNLRLSMSYRVIGPTETAGEASSTVPVDAHESRALMLTSKGNAASYEMAAGFPDLIEGLAPGWYRVQGAYQLVGEANAPADTFGYVINRRIFATPL